MKKVEYPIYAKSLKYGFVVEFSSRNKGTVVYVEKENKSMWKIGDLSSRWVAPSNKSTWLQITKEKLSSMFWIDNHKQKAFKIEEKDTSINNGGSTDYYQFEPEWEECIDVIEARKMNYNQGNIFKSAFCFNVGRHNGTDYERELNKIIFFANRELKRIKK